MATRKDDKDAAGREAAEEAMERGAKAADSGTRAVRQAAEEAAEQGRQQAERMREMIGMGNGLDDHSRADVDALMQSGARFAKGMQDASWEWLQFTQNSFRLSMKVANDMMTCRSVEDAAQIQRDYLRESMDTLLHESARILEISSSAASDALNPLSERTRH